jgi:regulator of protease activity HflC (stomatin/prohibitin superfamily)
MNIEAGTIQALIVGLILFITVLVFLAKTVKIVPQAHAGIVERLGRYQRTLTPGLALIIPFIDRVRPLIDQREQVVSFPPQPVITQDNLVVNIDSVIYFQVTDPKDASYEIADYITGVEQLTVTTLRNVVGGMDLERTLTSREEINMALRGVLDEATGRWGIRVNRVELKAIDPPPSIKDSMEKQMRAERDKRAAILNAEGNRQASILNAEGNRQAAILNAEGYAKSEVLRADAQAQAEGLRAQGQAQAIETITAALRQGRVDSTMLTYQYLRQLPEIAKGDANKVWLIPAEFGQAMTRMSAVLGSIPQPSEAPEPSDEESAQ